MSTLIRQIDCQRRHFAQDFLVSYFINPVYTLNGLKLRHQVSFFGEQGNTSDVDAATTAKTERRNSVGLKGQPRRIGLGDVFQLNCQYVDVDWLDFHVAGL